MTDLENFEQQTKDKITKMFKAIREAQEIGKAFGYKIVITNDSPQKSPSKTDNTFHAALVDTMLKNTEYGGISKIIKDVIEKQNGSFTIPSLIRDVNLEKPGLKLRQGAIYNIFMRLVKNKKIVRLTTGGKGSPSTFRKL